MKKKQKSGVSVKAKKLNCCFIICSNLAADKEGVEVWKKRGAEQPGGLGPCGSRTLETEGIGQVPRRHTGGTCLLNYVFSLAKGYTA